MNKQTGAIVLSIVFAVGTAAVSYAAETTHQVKGSDVVSPEASKPMKPSSSMDVIEGTNGYPADGIPPEVVVGKLLKIEKKTYFVKDWTGKEVHFQIDGRTFIDANMPKVGDRIRAEIEPQGYAYSVHAADEVTSAKN
jgi:hypothetical protein